MTATNTASDWRSGHLAFVFGEDTDIRTDAAVQFGNTVTSALLHGGGTSSSPLTCDVADKNFIGYWLKNSASSGTARGEYLRLYLTGGAGGEALRVFTTNSAAAPVDTVNGAHISLSHSGSGNVSGQASAARLTYHVPNANLGGTNAVVNLDAWADGASSAVTGNMAFIRCVLAGNGTGLAAVEDTAAFARFDGGSIAGGNMIQAKSSAAVTHVLRIYVGNVPYYIMLSNAV